MSLFSTIAHDRPLPMRQFGPKRRALVGVALAVAVGLAAVSLSPASEVAELTLRAAPGEFTSAQFIELNTVDLDALAPSIGVVTEDSFLYWNVDALEGFTPSLAASRVDSHSDDFHYWNIESIDYPTPVHPHSPTGPR